MSLHKFSTRSIQQRPGRTLLTIASIVIGVSAVVAVTIVTATTRTAYKQMFATVTGKANLEITVPGDGGFPGNELLAEVRKLPGVKFAVPLLERPSSITYGGVKARIGVMGVDPELDPEVRDYKIVAGRKPVEGNEEEVFNEVVLDEGFAVQRGIKLGDKVSLLTQRGPREFDVVGLTQPQGGAAVKQMALTFMPIERAQALLNRRGKTDLVDSIQIVTASDLDIPQVQAAISELITRMGREKSATESPAPPEGEEPPSSAAAPLSVWQQLRVRPPTANTQLMQRTLLSTEQGLRLSTYYTQLMAGFIILNTVLMSLGERRRQFAIMRAIGATRWQIMSVILREAVLLGLIGTVLGVVTGWFGGKLLVFSLSRAFEAPLPATQYSWLPILFAVITGAGVVLAGSLIPSFLARNVSPLEGMSRVTKEDMEGGSFVYPLIGFLLTAFSVGLIAAGIAGYVNIEIPAIAGVGMNIGLVLISPLILEPLCRLIAWVLSPLTRVEGVLALRQILRHRTRTTLTIGVLFVAGSTGVGMANSILDNVRDVREWYRQAIVGDFFVRAMMPDMAKGDAPDLPEGIAADLKQVQHVRILERLVFTEANSGEQSVRVIARDFVDPGNPAFDLVEGNADQLREQLFAGQVVIGAILSHDLNAHVGDSIPLTTSEGELEFKICGVANDYMVGGLSLYMQRAGAEKYFGVNGADGYVVRVESSEYLDEVKAALMKVAEKNGVLLQSNAEISRVVEGMVNGTEWGLWALVYLGFIVASFGVVNTLTMNVLEQTRELGMLRIVAMTKNQVRRSIVTQAMLMGAAGLAPGILFGILVAYVMNLAFLPSFGRAVEFHIYPGLLAGSLAGALTITYLAAWFPARRAAAIDPAVALQYE